MFGRGARFFRYRYLVAFVTLFIIGDSLAVFGGLANGGQRFFACFLVGGAACLIAAFVFALRKTPRLGAAAMCAAYLAALLLGLATASGYYGYKMKTAEALDGRTAEVYCRIASEPTPSRSGKTLTAEVRPESITADDAEFEPSGKIFVSMPLGTEAERGDGFYLKGKLTIPTDDLDGFDYRRYRLSCGSCLNMFAAEAEETELRVTACDRFLFAAAVVRKKIFDYCDTVFPEADAAALMKGILTGSREDFSDEFYGLMSGSGFMHIAAVSGLHIGFLCGFVFFMLRVFGRKTGALFAAPILIFYMAAADFSPSVVRAVIMTCIVLASWLFEKTPDLPTSLFASALIQCLINPFVTASVSFMMSYMATLALILFMPPLDPLLRRLSSGAARILGKRKIFSSERAGNIIYGACLAVLTSAAVSLACQIGITPIILHYFGRASLLSFFGNIVVVPCTMVVFVAGLICAAVYCASPNISAMLSFVAVYPFLKIIIALANVFSKFSYETMYTPGFFASVLYYFLALVLLNFLTNVSEKYGSGPTNAENP